MKYSVIVGLIMTVFMSACMSYIGIARDTDGTILVSYQKDYLIFKESGVYRCDSSTNKLDCKDMEIEETDTIDETPVGFRSSAARTRDTYTRKAVYKSRQEASTPTPTEAKPAPAEKVIPPPKPGELQIELGSFEKMDAGRDKVSQCIGKPVHVIKLDGKEVKGTMVGTGADKILLRGNGGTEGVHMMDIWFMSCAP